MLAARYGVEGGRLNGVAVRPHCGGVICMPYVGMSGLTTMSVVMGNGKQTLFWSDVWMGGLSIREMFSRLYDFSLFKDKSVFYMCQLGWEEEGEAWRWRRRLFAREEEVVVELTLLLHNVILQVDNDDRWL